MIRQVGDHVQVALRHLLEADRGNFGVLFVGTSLVHVVCWTEAASDEATYAVWSGIGAAGTALVGMLFLGEPAQAIRIGSIALIVAGVVGLRLTSAN